MRTESDEGLDMTYSKSAHGSDSHHSEKASNALIGNGHSGKMQLSPLWASLVLNGVFAVCLVLLATAESPRAASPPPLSWGAPASVCGHTTLDESHSACSRNGILFDGAEECVCFGIRRGLEPATPALRVTRSMRV